MSVEKDIRRATILKKLSYTGTLLMHNRAVAQSGGKTSHSLFVGMSLILSFMFFLAIFLTASIKARLPVGSVVRLFAQQLYVPDKNGLLAGNFLGHNAMLYFYGLFGILTLAALVALFGKGGRSERGRWKDMIITAAVITFLAQGVFQGFQHARTFVQEFKQFNGKTQEQRIAYYFKNSFAYARYCQRHLPGKHWGKVITDINIAQTQAMFTFFGVAYYLYPIDIRVDRQHPPDCLVIFLKENPLESVSADYRAREPFDEKSLIAIKKDAGDAGHH